MTEGVQGEPQGHEQNKLPELKCIQLRFRFRGIPKVIKAQAALGWVPAGDDEAGYIIMNPGSKEAAQFKNENNYFFLGSGYFFFKNR